MTEPRDVPPPDNDESTEEPRGAGRLIARFFLLPLLVVGAAVGVFLVFNLMTFERRSPRDYLQASNLSIEGLCHLVAYRYEEAVTAERRAVQLRPDLGTAWRTLTAAAGLAGDLELARQGLAECKRLQPNVSIAWVEKYYPLIRIEDRSRYIEGLRRAGLE